MEHSTQLTQALELAGVALKANDNGELALPLRKRLWSAMGPREADGARAILGPGLQRRTTLAILTVRHVLPIWETAFPTNHKPEWMLAVAQEYLDQLTDFQTVRGLNNLFWSELDCLGSVAVAVGYAAAQSVTTALSDERFDPAALDTVVSDQDLDPYQWDASFYASVAYAGSAPWEEKPHTNRRREFWTWFLEVAVPAAWDSASQT